MRTSATGSTMIDPRSARNANASEPNTTSRSVPTSIAMRGNAYMSGTSMLAPNAHAMPTSPALPPIATTWIE